jgi:hypothetical protein
MLSITRRPLKKEIAYQKIAGSDHDLGRQWKLGAHLPEHVGENRDDFPQNDTGQNEGDHQNADRVSHGRLHFADQFVHVFNVLRKAEQDGIQITGSFAGLYHAGVQFVEDLGMLFHGVGQVGTGFDILAYLQQHALEKFILLLVAQDANGLGDGQSGIEHDRKLAIENGDGLERNAFAATDQGQIEFKLLALDA